MTTIETHETVVLHAAGGEEFRPRCPRCGSPAMLTLDEAALLAGVSPLAILRWVQDERVHATGSARAILWVCAQSIEEVQAPEKQPDRRELQ